MKTLEILKLIEGGWEPIIRFNSKIEEVDNGPDNGMLGRIIGVGRIECDGDEEFVKLSIDVESFREHNEKHDGKTYFNDNKPISWFESGYYPEDGKCFELYEMTKIDGEESEPLFFDVCDKVLVKRFLELGDKHKTYIQFLEDAARKQYDSELSKKLKSVNNQ